MNPAAILRDVEADGVRLALSAAGKIKATGPASAVARWADRLRAHKSVIVAALRSDGPAFDREDYEERAAIIEHDAGLPRELAEVLAWAQSIGETDDGALAELLDLCRRDADALAYYLGRAASHC